MPNAIFRFNWFSPLSPARTEIAQHTLRLLPALARQAELVLWTDQEEWDPALADFGQVRRCRLRGLTPRDFGPGDVNVYNLGNDVNFHRRIWELSRRLPGIVVLHDLCLFHFFVGYYRRTKDWRGFRALLKRWHGAEGVRAADAGWSHGAARDSLAVQFPLSQAAAENARGIVVHNPLGCEQLRRHDHRPVVYVPLPYGVTPRQTAAHVLPSGPPYRVIVIGHLGSNRRLESILRALAACPQRQEFQLDVYGNVSQAAEVQTLIRTLQLPEQVTLHGFVPEDRLAAALDAAHLAFNLRFPTMGEASASQLRIWDHALPSIVTRVGWYATLPQETVAFVRQETEIADLLAHLAAFRSRPADYTALGLNGRRLLEEQHTPDGYALRLLTLAAEVQTTPAESDQGLFACKTAGRM